LVLPLFEEEKPHPDVQFLDKKLNGSISRLLKKKDFEGKPNEVRMMDTQGLIGPDQVLLVGLGKKGDLTGDRFRQAMAASAKTCKKYGVGKFSAAFDLVRNKKIDPVEFGQQVAEGCLLSLYEFSVYRTESKNERKKITEATILVDSSTDPAKIQSGVGRAEKIVDKVFLARDLINHPGNTVTPTYLANTAKQLSRKFPIRCRILDKKEQEKLGMGAFLSVSRGSTEPPKFIILEYRGGKPSEAPVVLVGKGITFDTGGISIKPSAGMEEMKTDMSGGAAVIASLAAAADLKLPVNLVGLVPTTDNMPSGSATKPGDIVKSLSGKTIEILNTDAEGRLILSDALTYAERYKPKAVIDLATLTGACVVALGHEAIGLLGNDEELIKKLIEAGEATGERCWQLPLWESYEDLMKSDVADIKNIGSGRQAGTITAGIFLKKFASNYKWAHLDIAGTAWSDKEKPYVPKGAVGVGVRLLIKYLESLRN
jgi:leucyl aminopeptidase